MFLFDHTQVADGLVQESLDRFLYSVGGGPQIAHFFRRCVGSSLRRQRECDHSPVRIALAVESGRRRYVAVLPLHFSVHAVSILLTRSATRCGLPRAAMSDLPEHFSQVANFTPECGTPNCPFCYVRLPHNATAQMVQQRCFEITTTTRMQMQSAALMYGHNINGLRSILDRVRPEARLHVVRSVEQLFDLEFATQYETYMRPHADFNQLPGRGGAAPSAAGADVGNATPGPSASGSVGTIDKESRFLGEEEYPRWEFQGGKPKKFKWSVYSREQCELLEAAFALQQGTLTLTIDGWVYEIDLLSMQQRSVNTGMLRGVRRLTGPAAA